MMKTRLILFLWVCATFFAVPVFGQVGENDGISTIGSAEITILPNVAYVTTAFMHHDKEHRTALSKLNKDVKRVTKWVNDHNPDHVAVSSIQSTPYGQGHALSQTMVVRMKDFSKLLEMMELLNEQPRRTSIIFSHTDLKRLERQVTKAAAIDARNSAFQLASVTGMKLTGVKKMNNPQVKIQLPQQRYFSIDTPRESSFAVGMLTLRQNITATFHVAPMKRVASHSRD